MDQLEQRAASKVLHRHLFKDNVVFLAINVDSQFEGQPMYDQAKERWPNLHHFWADEKAVRALHIQFVPNRLMLRKNGSIARWWDGTNGKVVDGKFGSSRANNSSNIADEIAALLED